jgi:hypothetical protein
MTMASERLTAAIDLPGVLDSAYDAFEDVLAVLRHHQEDDDEAAFAAFVFAACAAANGRDWVAWAPALPPATPREPADDLLERACVTEVALAIAQVSFELVRRLTACAANATDLVDRACCGHAAAEAETIHALMSDASPP